ncbi:hypothetical protein Dimus_010452 [Dionaea muscipula]
MLGLPWTTMRRSHGDDEDASVSTDARAAVDDDEKIHEHQGTNELSLSIDGELSLSVEGADGVVDGFLDIGPFGLSTEMGGVKVGPPLFARPYLLDGCIVKAPVGLGVGSWILRMTGML